MLATPFEFFYTENDKALYLTLPFTLRLWLCFAGFLSENVPPSSPVSHNFSVVKPQEFSAWEGSEIKSTWLKFNPYWQSTYSVLRGTFFLILLFIQANPILQWIVTRVWEKLKAQHTVSWVTHGDSPPSANLSSPPHFNLPVERWLSLSPGFLSIVVIPFPSAGDSHHRLLSRLDVGLLFVTGQCVEEVSGDWGYAASWLIALDISYNAITGHRSSGITESVSDCSAGIVCVYKGSVCVCVCMFVHLAGCVLHACLLRKQKTVYFGVPVSGLCHTSVAV